MLDRPGAVRAAVQITRVALSHARRRARRTLRTLLKSLRRKQALFWLKAYRIRFFILVQIARHGASTRVALLLLLVSAGAFWIVAPLQRGLETLFTTEKQLQDLRVLFVTLGGALLGGAAIVSSLVLFAMQVNVERMPHGLFRRISADRRLLSAFAATFLLAVFVATLSLIPDAHMIGAAVYAACWTTGLVLILFLYVYRRALILINPIRQLGFVIAKVRREFRAWVRRARRAAPLLGGQPQASTRDDDRAQHDTARLAYFQANPGWTEGAKQGIRYAVSLARRYAEHGDHEVSAAATNTIVAINTAYVEAKGPTFFTYHFMLDNPLTSDDFINDTLEHLRQTSRIAISRGDEQQIEQTLRAFAALVRVYSTIDYGSPEASKTHAHLAAGYLTAEVERIAPHNMPDVLMEGARLMGQCANVLLSTEGATSIRTLTQKLGTIACCGVVKEDYRPVTSTCVEQLARLDFDLLRTRSRDVQYATKEIRDNMSFIAKMFLAVSDTPLTNTHSTFLGPYYSSTSSQALPARLTALVNAVADAKADDENAQLVISNIEEWADGMYAAARETLLEAISKRSQFTFDMINWITQVTAMLLAVSNAPACDEYDRDELRKHAGWLISTLSFIPDDIETVQFIENFRLTETLFEAVLDAHRRDCLDLEVDITGILVSWMFDGGQYPSGWGTLEKAIYGLAVLALLAEANGAIPKLKGDITKRLAAGGLPDQSVRDHAAREIRGRANTLYRQGHWGSSIETGIANADHAKLKPLLEELADLISPGTAGQAASHNFF